MHKPFISFFLLYIMVSPCLKKARNAGTLIPQCPPNNTIELGNPKTAEADYYLWAFAQRSPYKATYDMLVNS
jgi:hypothetical protein